VVVRHWEGGAGAVKEYFSIMRHRRWFFLVSGLITLAGLVVFLLFGFNLGTDFRSGARVQMQLNQPVDPDKVRNMFQSVGISVAPTSITVAGLHGDTAIVRLPETLSQGQIAAITRAEKQYFPKAVEPEVRSVDPVVAQQTSRKAVLAVLLASLFIVIYITIRFEYRFAIAAIVALLHDAFIVLSVFAMLRLEVDLSFVAAVLTIVGYSINDTIVIFDRIRENLKIAPPQTFEQLERLVDKSLWQTMSRSINTVVTVLIAAVMLFLFGGQTIHNFTFALIVGLISGAYSSIFIASPLWVEWRGRTLKRAKAAQSGAV
jgi:preprotein translocase subunit SecF